ncbi:MAG: hypothetical protein RSH79_07290 [Clostridiales bacterium]
MAENIGITRERYNNEYDVKIQILANGFEKEIGKSIMRIKTYKQNPKDWGVVRRAAKAFNDIANTMPHDIKFPVKGTSKKPTDKEVTGEAQRREIIATVSADAMIDFREFFEETQLPTYKNRRF